MKEDLNEVAVGYEGGLYDWIEYFSLDNKYLPTGFNTNRISFNGGSLQIELNDFMLDLKSKKINEKTSLHFHFGYSNTSLLEEELLLFELFPQKGVDAHYRIRKFFSPSKFSSDQYKSQWDEISDRSGDFSAKVVTNNSHQEIRKVISGREEEFLSVDGEKIKRKFVIACRYKLSVEDVHTKCNKFIGSVSFKEGEKDHRDQSLAISFK